MNRLILGDVGSGKTIVAFIALYMNYITGYQGVMMAPTEILAKQHYENMINLFKNFDLKMELLTSSTLKKTRSDIIKRLASGDVDVLIGVYNKIQLKKEDKIKETASNLNSEEIIKLMKDLYYAFTDKQLPICFLKDVLNFNEQEIKLVSIFNFIKENGGLED